MTEKKAPEVIETTAVAVIESAGMLAEREVEAFAARVEAYGKMRKTLMHFIGEQLVAGVDYMVIHQKIPGTKENGAKWNDAGKGYWPIPCPNKIDTKRKDACPECHAKPTLLQSGAEKVTNLMRLSVEFVHDPDTLAMLGAELSKGLLCIKARLINNQSGEIVAEGRGARNTINDKGDLNKSIKMCQKSAHVDAIKRLAGLSEMFTQDMDLYQPEPETTPTIPVQAVKPPAPAMIPPSAPKAPEMGGEGPQNANQPPTTTPESETKPANAMTGKQRGFLFSLFKSDENAIKAAIISVLKVDKRISELTKGDAKALIDWVKANPAPTPITTPSDADNPFTDTTPPPPDGTINEELDLDVNPFAEE